VGSHVRFNSICVAQARQDLTSMLEAETYLTQTQSSQGMASRKAFFSVFKLTAESIATERGASIFLVCSRVRRTYLQAAGIDGDYFVDVCCLRISNGSRSCGSRDGTMPCSGASSDNISDMLGMAKTHKTQSSKHWAMIMVARVAKDDVGQKVLPALFSRIFYDDIPTRLKRKVFILMISLT
jgi:hypothetical protein